MAYALKTACARNIIGVIPYFPYSKQSKMRKRGSIVCKLLASMLAKAGACNQGLQAVSQGSGPVRRRTPCWAGPEAGSARAVPDYFVSFDGVHAACGGTQAPLLASRSGLCVFHFSMTSSLASRSPIADSVSAFLVTAEC